jgi:hypothetical protein
MHQVLRRIVVCCAAGLLGLTPSAAQAGFIASTTGPVDVISAPASAMPGAIASNSYQAWDESTGTISSPGVQVNLLGQSGNYDGLTNFSTLGGTLAAGTKYDSVMVQLDPKTGFPPPAPIATITFTGKIIGLALFGPSLDASDIYGNPTTTYPHILPAIGVQNRGIDMTHNEKFSISSNGLTLSLQLAGGFGSFDEIRIFTAPDVAGVPEPMSLAIWAGIGLVVGLRRRSLLPV